MARPATAMGKCGSPRSFNLARISACVQRPKASKRDSEARHRRRYYPGATAAIAPRGFCTGLSVGAPFARLIGLILASSCTARHGGIVPAANPSGPVRRSASSCCAHGALAQHATRAETKRRR